MLNSVSFYNKYILIYLINIYILSTIYFLGLIIINTYIYAITLNYVLIITNNYAYLKFF